MNTRRKKRAKEVVGDEGENAGDTNNRQPSPQAPPVKGTTIGHQDAEQSTPLTRFQRQVSQGTPPTVSMKSKLAFSVKFVKFQAFIGTQEGLTIHHACSLCYSPATTPSQEGMQSTHLSQPHHRS